MIEIKKYVSGTTVPIENAEIALYKVEETTELLVVKKITNDTTGIILPAVSSLPEYPILNMFFPASNKTLVLKK